MKKIWLFMIPFSIILISFTGCVRNSYSFEEPIDEIESIEIVWAESSLEFTVTRILSEEERNDFLEQFQAIQFYRYLGDPPTLYGDSIKITYSNGDYEMICCYTAEYVKNDEVHFLFKRCDEEDFDKLLNKFLEKAVISVSTSERSAQHTSSSLWSEGIQ